MVERFPTQWYQFYDFFAPAAERGRVTGGRVRGASAARRVGRRGEPLG